MAETFLAVAQYVTQITQNGITHTLSPHLIHLTRNHIHLDFKSRNGHI